QHYHHHRYLHSFPTRRSSDLMRGILDNVKRTYNIDENRVVIAGVSDGATAAFYFAMRDTTPYASFESLNGFLMVLSNARVGASEDRKSTRLNSSHDQISYAVF